MRCKPPCLAWINSGFNVGAVVQVTPEFVEIGGIKGWVIDDGGKLKFNCDGQLAPADEEPWVEDARLTSINGPTTPDVVVNKEKELENV